MNISIKYGIGDNIEVTIEAGSWQTVVMCQDNEGITEIITQCDPEWEETILFLVDKFINS